MSIYHKHKNLLLALSLMLSTRRLQAQTEVNAPMTSPPAAGEYFSYTGITLSPGFSFTATTGQSLHLYITDPDCRPLATAVSASQNYIMTSVPRTGITTESGLLNRNTCELMQTIQYFDGLGRPLQTVQVKGSPQGVDVVQPVVYDQFGREAVKSLPYVLQSGNSDGSYKTNALTAQPAFYTTPPAGVSVIPSPYAVTIFEPSPLNRVTEQGAPGNDWQPAAGHTVKMDYTTNNITALTDTANSRIVVLYAISAIDATTQQRTLVRGVGANVNYPAGELFVTVSKDENWKDMGLGQGHSRGGTTEEYKDKEGHVVLKRTFNWLPGTLKLEILSTYYVYDDLGNLAYVLPPGANPDAGLTSTASQTVLDNLCYQYRYDERNRLTQKKLPGKGWEYTVYNKLDQAVATQDANQRGKTTPEWTITRYDALGRVVMTGIYNFGAQNAETRAIVQGQANGFSKFWETPTGVSANYGYTTQSFPMTVNATLTVNYYDDYLFPDKPYNPTVSNSLTSPTGLLTGTRTAVLNPDGTYGPLLWGVNYYDAKGRSAQSYKQHYLGGLTKLSNSNYDEVANTYNFNDQVTQSIRHHYTTANLTAATVVIGNSYDYDHMGRKINTFEQIINGTQAPDAKILLAQNKYNETGQLWKKYLHSTDQGASFKQDITYTYNERGWLLSSSAPLFATQLYYNTGTKKQYNGNIAYQYWGLPGNLNKNYAYDYDQLNRLKAATSAAGNHENGIDYDMMGNITKLNRYAASTQIDQLSYTYTAGTNQLLSVTDATTNNTGLKSGIATYTYDANGNLTSDNSKGITGATGITYNLLNLPRAIAAKGITYTYDASGQKLSRLMGTAKTDYIGGIQYDGTATVSTINFIQTEEGRALANGAIAYNYEYALTDHLGNSRVNFDTGTGTGAARLVQADDYYAFGMDIPVGNRPSLENKYLYNKKELQDNLGLYDYGARFYDPVIARWTSVDPLAEKMRRYSPYNYGFGNSIRFIDPDGMGPTDIVFKGTDNKELRIKAAGDDKVIDVPFALKSNSTYDIGIGNIDPGRFAFGYNLSADAGFSVGLGARWGGDISVVNFTDSKYSGYNYVYAGGHSAVSAGAQADFSASAGVNVFVAYNNDTQPLNPTSWAGAFKSVGVSTDVKAIVGGGVNISAFTGSDSFSDKGWKGISFGVNVGVGASVNLGTVNTSPSYSFLLNDVKPTDQRSFIDRATNLIAPIPAAITTAIKNAIIK